jgi:tRNA A-37 threonylcarbamoyl transferase component Bud32
MLPTADEPRPATPPPDEPLPEQIGRYRILERLGTGGMGTVYKAHDPQLERVVALKLPRFDGPQRDRANRVQRFQREARAAAQVWHPHVCPIYDVGEHEGQPFVVMAYVEGQSLAERLAGKGRYEDVNEAVALLRQVLDALGAVHARGIIHRDLKPSNIMVDAAGRAVLTDFGLARPESDTEHLTSDGVVVGTPAYMAPEQAAGETERIGPWTDLYTLGVVFYQMLTGRLPFQGPQLKVLAQILHDPIPAPTSLHPDLDVALEAIVLHATAKEPEGRYQNARQFAEALSGWSGSAQGSAAATITAGAPASGDPGVGESGGPKDSATYLTPADRPHSAPVRKSRLPLAPLGCLLAALLPVAGCVGLVSMIFVRGCGGVPPSTKSSKPLTAAPQGSMAAKQMHHARVDPTTLLEAAEKGRLVRVEELIDQGVPLNAKDSKGETALMKAAARGHVPVVRELLVRSSRGMANFINEQDKQGETALMKAAESGHAEVVKVLLGHILIEPDLKDDKGKTAAMKAKEKGNEDIVELLKNFKK